MDKQIKIDQKEITLTIRFKELRVLNVSYFPQKDLPKKKNSYLYNLRTNNQINFAKGLFECTINVVVKANSTSKKNVFELTVKNVFEITNMKDYPRNEKGEWLLIAEFFQNMIGISISTTRGVLFTESQKVGFNDMILPVFDPRKFTQNMYKATPTK